MSVKGGDYPVLQKIKGQVTQTDDFNTKSCDFSSNCSRELSLKLAVHVGNDQYSSKGGMGLGRYGTFGEFRAVI